MFSAEEGAWEIIEKAQEKYEKHFEQEFPVYDYLSVTKSNEYDFSVDGAKKLSALIVGCIERDEPVPMPKGYEGRIY